MVVPCTALWAVLLPAAWTPTGASSPAELLYKKTPNTSLIPVNGEHCADVAAVQGIGVHFANVCLDMVVGYRVQVHICMHAGVHLHYRCWCGKWSATGCMVQFRIVNKFIWTYTVDLHGIP